MKAVTKNLIRAQEKGILSDQKVLIDTIESVARNFHVRGPKGNRYKSSTRKFFEALLILGGPRIANFVAINMGGPNLNAIYRWRKINLISFKPGVHGENFAQYAVMVKGIMELYKISPVPVLTAEDETAIVSVIQYHQDRDELLGFCGLKFDNPKDHVCLEECHIRVGNGPNAYNTIINAFENYKKGNYARVIMLNPLHKEIPKLVALLMPTCNRFDHHSVYRQWQNIHQCYSDHLEPILGPLIGHSSDGDSRRRKLQVQIMSCSVGERFQPIPSELGFIFSARKEVDNRMISGYVIRELGDQDPIHNHKKIINHLDHVSRSLFIGPFLTVHMNHIERVLIQFPTFRHGLTRDHVRRDRDRQNWKVAQELTFMNVQDCLEEIISGNEENPPDPSVKGTKAFLHLVYHYVEIFFSKSASLSMRIKYSGFVCHFLGIWRNFIHIHPGMTLSNNFLSRETYTDLLISCHFCVILVCFNRDNFPNEKCYLEMVGSDCCEEFFSKNGQHVGNHHVFPYGQMFRNLGHMIRLNQIEVDDNAPAFAKAHIKQENIWHTQAPGAQTCTLRDYPVANSEIDEWKNGMEMARKLAKELGMKPCYFRDDNDDDPHNPDNGWFYQPFKNGDHSKLFRDLNSDEVDDCCDGGESDGNDGDGDNCQSGCSLEEDAGVDNNGNSDMDHGGEEDDNTDRDTQHPLEGTMDEMVEVQDALSAAVSSVETEDNNDSHVTRESVTVHVPGHGLQYKSTLVKLLNEDPNLSKDRLVRVRQVQEEQPRQQSSEGDGLSLFEDYAYLDRENKTFRVGRLQRMKRMINRRFVEYKETVSFSETYLKDIQTSFVQYDKHKQDETVFSLKEFTVVTIKGSDIITHVNLSYDKDDTFFMPEGEMRMIKEFVDKTFQKRKAKRSKQTQQQIQNETEFDGEFCVEVTPTPSTDGRRASMRKRKERHYLS